MTTHFLRRFTASRAAVLLLGALGASPAMAIVDLRVEARPITDPIQAFVRVTNNVGDPIVGLDSGDFAVTLDGVSVILVPQDVTLPPAQDPTQRVSVVFAMDYSTSVVNAALDAMQTAVTTFIDGMEVGDYAAIIKFNGSSGATVVAGFTAIDQAAGSAALIAAVENPYPGAGTNLLDGINLGVDQFVTPPVGVVLPSGPKAIVVISDGGENQSNAEESDVIEYANANSIAVFSIGVGDLTLPGREGLLTGLAVETGGQYFPTSTDDEITDAYASISALLSDEYLITIPSGISDCAVHTLVVAVANQPAPASVEFTRRVCDTEPNPFSFTNQTGVAVNTAVTSNTITIMGLEVPADISTQIGTYSIGCNGTFTGTAGTISNGETVCVRHTSSAAASTTNTTTLSIGGIAGTFTSTTQAASGGGGGGGGGGGATGGLELLAGLAALFARRRRRV